MEINVAQALKVPGKNFPLDASEDFAPLDLSFCAAHFAGPVSLTGHYYAVGESILLNVRLEAAIRIPCDRCLEPFVLCIDEQMRDEFVRTADDAHPDHYPYAGQIVVLDAAIIDCVRLAVPLRNLCRADCPGLRHETNNV